MAPPMKMDPYRTRDSESNGRPQTRCVAFEGPRRIASGDLLRVARKTKEVIDRGERGPIVVFDEATSRLVEIDFRGTAEQVLERLRKAEAAAVAAMEIPDRAGPGRPKLGVVSREVTLLPRHWEWLNG